MPDLIQYTDGVKIEVVPAANRTTAISDSEVDRLKDAFGSVVKVIEPLVRPLQETVTKLLAEGSLKEVEVKLGLSFTAEGSLFVTKASSEANLEVTFTYGRPD